MVKPSLSTEQQIKELQLEVATAACRVAGKSNSQGAFIDLALDLWDALQARLNQSPAGVWLGQGAGAAVSVTRANS